MITRPKILSRVILAILLTTLLACSSEETVAPEIQRPGTGNLLRTAWSHFDAQNYDGALEFFDQALVNDPASFDAHLGRGWSLLKVADSMASLEEAAAAFELALLLENANFDALCGRAAAKLSIGGAGIVGAVEDVEVILQNDPDYEFHHGASFNHVALRLIQAQAQVALGNFDSALLSLDAIFFSGIMEPDSGTWVVEGMIEGSFGAAVLSHLDRVERLWSGGNL